MASVAPSMPTAASDPETPRPEPIFRRCGFCRGCGLSENLGVNMQSIGERPCWFCEGTGMVPDFTTAYYERKKGDAA